MTNNYNMDPYQGFIRGNLFEDLYIPYKNYKVKEFSPKSEEEYNKLLVQIYSFAAHELTMYLDMHPEDKNAQTLRTNYEKLYKHAKNEFENKYYALDSSSEKLYIQPWSWIKNWPWEDRNV